MSDNKKYYWFKMKDDFFQSKEIKKLRKIAGGDTYCVIFLKMILLSLKTDGRITFDGVEDSFTEEIALTIDEDVDNVKVLLMFLIKNKLVEESDDDEITIIETIKSTGSESASAERVRNYREKQQQKALQCNNQVTKCNTEIEIERELKKEKDIDSGVDPKKIIDIFHKICVSLPKVKELSDVRKKNIKKRFEGKTDAEIQGFFQIIEDSDFLCGRSSAWSANIDWVLKAENFIKISENNYINKSGGKKTAYEAKAEREFKEEEQWESSFGGDKSMQDFVKQAKEDWAKKKASKV